MSFFRWLKKVFGSCFGLKEKESVFTWNQARFEATIQSETEEGILQMTSGGPAGDAGKITKSTEDRSRRIISLKENRTQTDVKHTQEKDCTYRFRTKDKSRSELLNYANPGNIEEPDLDALIACEAELSWVDTEGGCIMVTRPIPSRILVNHKKMTAEKDQQKEFIDVRNVLNRECKENGTDRRPTPLLIQILEKTPTLPVELLALVLVHGYSINSN